MNARAGRVLAVLAATFAIATLTAGLMGIWFDDDRWSGSAFLFFFAALLFAAAAAVSAEAS